MGQSNRLYDLKNSTYDGTRDGDPHFRVGPVTLTVSGEGMMSKLSDVFVRTPPDYNELSMSTTLVDMS